MLERIHRSTTLLALAVTACGVGTSDASRGSTVRDSAGIQIVENTQPGWSAANAWRLADAPATTMGAAEGDPDHEFYQVRGAVRLSDGTIVVANGGTHQLRFYGPDGALTSTAGRQGSGPGEFEMLASLEKLADDSLLALDMRHRRLSVFTADGQHVRDVPLQGSSPLLFVTLIGPLGDGTFLASAPNVRMGPDLFNRPLGPTRDSIQLVRVDASGATVDTLGVFPGPRVNVKSVDMGPRTMPMGVPVVFSSMTVTAAAEGVAYVGITDTYEIAAYAPTGEVRRIIRKTHAPRVVTEADKERYQELIRSRAAPTGNAQMRAMMQQMSAVMADAEFAETFPAFGRMLVDAGGNLWVSDSRPSEDEPQLWTVFDSDGRLLGGTTIPAKLVVTEIGADYVLGHQTDELEIQHILLYDLIKPEAASR
jgi:hypothetical protein